MARKAFRKESQLAICSWSISLLAQQHSETKPHRKQGGNFATRLRFRSLQVGGTPTSLSALKPNKVYKGFYSTVYVIAELTQDCELENRRRVGQDTRSWSFMNPDTRNMHKGWFKVPQLERGQNSSGVQLNYIDHTFKQKHPNKNI